MHIQYQMYNHGFDRFWRVLEKYPTTRFIGHAQTMWANIDKLADQKDPLPQDPRHTPAASPTNTSATTPTSTPTSPPAQAYSPSPATTTTPARSCSGTRTKSCTAATATITPARSKLPGPPHDQRHQTTRPVQGNRPEKSSTTTQPECSASRELSKCSEPPKRSAMMRRPWHSL